MRLAAGALITDPPLVRAELSEGEGQTQGIAVRVGHLPMGSVLRTEATDGTQGFLKVLVGADDRILGFTMIADEQKAEAVALVPLGRIGTPDDVGKAAVFLASDDSAYVTGIELFVDGGVAQI